jgi:DUF1680 family protein
MARWSTSDVYKMLEGVSHTLPTYRDPALEANLDSFIAEIAGAQQPDGYLNTWYSLAEPGKRWTDLREKHELHCAGHLFEAAVAHHRATGKKLWGLPPLGDGRFTDVFEQALLNGLLSGVGLDGKKFFYVNPLASRGKPEGLPCAGFRRPPWTRLPIRKGSCASARPRFHLEPREVRSCG